MEVVWHIIALTGASIWFIILLLPWRPWSVRESLDSVSPSGDEDLSDVTALIPARNEAEMVGTTLPALAAQGRGLNIILVDDQSTDGTGQAARGAAGARMQVISGEPLPTGWTGKLWALEQGRQQIRTPYTLLLDADIGPQPGIVAALRKAMKDKNVQLVSLMAVLPMESFWERLLMPAFVYFFKLLYPFRLSNTASSKIAAAAGGCMLLETRILDEIGGFGTLRGELIDDCALARRVKASGYMTWTGLSHSVRSLREYESLGTIWKMVARTAFTQLQYSSCLLALCTIIMAASFWGPVSGLLLPSKAAKVLSVLGLVAMILGYLPTLKFYGRSTWWTLTMPLIGTLYLTMTWTSAARYWLGKGSQWKGRAYS